MVQVRKLFFVPISSSVFLTFFSTRLSVPSGLMLSFMIHLELTLVKCLISFFYTSSLTRIVLLKMLSFFQCIFLASWSKSSVFRSEIPTRTAYCNSYSELQFINALYRNGLLAMCVSSQCSVQQTCEARVLKNKDFMNRIIQLLF